MTLSEYLSTPIQAKDFICQPNLLPYCDFVYHSDFFTENYKKQFGISDLSTCIKEPPDCSAIIMCRFKDGEVADLISKCAKKEKYTYVIVQTLIGDDGFLTQEQTMNLPQNIRKIFSKNVYFDHEKVSPIPIGKDWRNTRDDLDEMYTRNDIRTYRKLAYLNFSLETNPEIREFVYKKYKDELWVTARLPEAYKIYNITHLEYAREMHDHTFSFSPTGRALDCYRTWDALYAKSLPIVDRNNHTKNWSDLPLLITKDWSEITQGYLKQTFHDMLDKEYAFEKLTARYWGDVIQKEKSYF